MCRKILSGAWVVLCLALLVDVGEARETLLSQLVRNNSNLLRFNIVDGRVLLQWSRMPNMEVQSGAGDSKEKLRLRDGNGNGRGGGANLYYERTSSDEQVTIEFRGSGDDLVITRAPRGKASFLPMEFKQSPGEPTSLRLGPPEREEIWRAAGLWQLFVIQPTVCRQHLIPVLEILRANWNLSDMTVSMETQLLEAARQDTAASRGRWEALVKRLGDDRFASREAADRALRAGGADSLQYLRRVDLQQLDAEQEFRVRRIIRSLAGETDGDSPEAAAAAMLHDRWVWLALLERPEPATRKTAAQRLAVLLGEPIEVDPAANPDSQKAERERLRAKLEKK